MQRNQQKNHAMNKQSTFPIMGSIILTSMSDERIFDCSVDFKGMSLNKNLMSGSDLTNQIVWVVIRYLEEAVVRIGDIESMFHQVLVPEYDCSLLRFLW